MQEPQEISLYDRQRETGTLFRKTSFFPKFERIVRSGENPIVIAQMFNIDHTTVFYWKHRFGLTDEQPDMDTWPNLDRHGEDDHA